MTSSFEKAKEEEIQMYHMAKCYEANNTRLRHALKLCQQAFEVGELLIEYRNLAPESGGRGHHHNGSANSSYFPSFDSSFDASARSPDREACVTRNSLHGRMRNLLSQLESNPELQNYMPYGRHNGGGGRGGHGSGEYPGHGHWPAITLSQNTGTTSGLSSMSGGTDVEITPNDLERLKQYSQVWRD